MKKTDTLQMTADPAPTGIFSSSVLKGLSICTAAIIISGLLFSIVFPSPAHSADMDEAVTSFLDSAGTGADSRGETLRVIVGVRGPAGSPSVEPAGHSGAIAALLRGIAATSQRGVRSFLASRGVDPENSKSGSRFIDLWIANSFVATLDRDTIRALSDREEIEAIAAEGIVWIPAPLPAIPRGPKGKVAWSLSVTGADRVWSELGVTGRGVVAGLIDTGVFADHPDLAGKVLAFRDFTRDPAGQSVPAYDDQGHGTHCAGTICGGETSGTAIGVAPDARLIAAKVFKAGGSADDGAILAAMQWMLDPDGDPKTDDAPALVSNSWGSSEQTDRFFWKIVEVWRGAGIFPNFAAGNSGPGAKTMSTPGGFPHSFAVGATARNDKIASFSSRGPITWDGQILVKPDVTAPGQDITSASHRGGYTTMSGTSMACPNVSGAIALLLSARPDLGIDDMAGVLEETSVDLGEKGRDNVFGSGRIDTFKAVEKVLLGGKVEGVVNGPPLNGGESVPVKATVTVIERQATVSCDERGAFAIQLPEGVYTLLFEAFGRKNASRTATVVRHATTRCDAVMEPSQMHALQGKVIDDDGAGVHGRITAVGTPVEPEESAPDGTFRFLLPAGRYDFVVNSFGHASHTAQGVEVGPGCVPLLVTLHRVPPVLLVDQTGGNGGALKFYREALAATGRSFDLFTATNGTPSTEIMVQYPTVIWFTCNAVGGFLTETNQAQIRGYLGAGGNLFMTGSEIGYRLKTTPFFEAGLKARYLRDDSTTFNVEGTGFLEGLKGDISGDLQGLKQEYPDVVEPLEGAVEILRYPPEFGIGGICSMQGPSRVVFFAFGLAGIRGAENRRAFLGRILDWLEPDVDRAMAAYLGLLTPGPGSPDGPDQRFLGDALLNRAFLAITADGESLARFDGLLGSLDSDDAEALAPLVSRVTEYRISLGNQR